jgi:hypothetical protein
LGKHPHLADFLNNPGAEISSIKIRLFQLLDGVEDALSICTIAKIPEISTSAAFFFKIKN